MKYLKSFGLLTEGYGESGNISYDDIKNLESYKRLIGYGFVDMTSPLLQKRGNLKFKHPSSDFEYGIFSNGYIRYTNTVNFSPYSRKPSPGVYVSPLGETSKDQVYGRPIKDLKDFDLKFEYVISIFLKSLFKSSGIKLNPSLSSKQEISDFLDAEISKNADFAKNPAVKILISQGLFEPNEHSKSMIGMSEFGII